MLDQNAAAILHRDVDAVCTQILKTWQEVVIFTRSLAELDPELAELVRQKVSRMEPGLADLLARNQLYFELVQLLEDTAITEILKRLDKKTLTFALKGCSEELQNQFFRNMPSKSVALMQEEMEFLGPVRLRDVQKCQREIVDVIQGLRDEGVIVIGGGSGPEEYVC